MPNEHAFTLRAQWLGQQLREMREGAGLTLKDVGNYLQRDGSTVSRIESGRLPARVPEVLTYLDLCGVDDPKRRADLKNMAEDVWQKGWWDGFTADVVGSLIDWIWLESRASEISSFEIAAIPGLLQTREYAEALIRTVDVNASQERIARFVEIRMTRQQRLTDSEPVNLSVIIDESALRRPVGGVQVMYAQLEHLQQVTQRPHVEVMVLPTDTGAHPSPEGAFNVLRMRPPYPVVGCISTPAGNLVIEGAKAESLPETYNRLREMALPEESALAFISDLMSRLE